MKARSRQLLSIATLTCIGVAPLAAQAEPEEWGDHPMVPRIEGSEILAYDYTELDRVTLTFGPREDGEFEHARELEGEHTQLLYLLRNPDVSTLQVKRAYREGLEQAGFEIDFAGSGDELGRRFHRFDLFGRSRPSGMSVHDIGWPRDKDDMRFIAASHADEDVYVNALIHPNRREGEPVLRVDVVEKPMEEPTLGVAAPQPPEEQPTEREDIVAAHDAQNLTAEEIESDLVSEGRVAVRDILFEFDSAAIIDESADALAVIAEFLETNDDLELVIVGHTDNVGSFDYNLNLSLARAQAVSDWLEERHGIDDERLQAAGAGMMAPVATNRNEDGRSQNRRVELVER
ncbi:MAG: OmpA family protein [Salinarimonas sp.]|nr:OmpA family protein [Salinarimonas sp.]